MSIHRSDILIRGIDIPWKPFVRELCEVPENSAEKKIRESNIQGEEARTAYEEILNQESSTNLQLVKLKHLKSRVFSNQNNSLTKSLVSNGKLKKSQSSEDIIPNVTINMILKAVEQKDKKFLSKHVTQDNVNLTDDFGWTPLMSATYCGHMDIVKFLLSLGANRKARDKSGHTAAQLALKKNYLSIVALLRKRTECISEKPLSDTTPDVSKMNIEIESQTILESSEPLMDCNGSAYINPCYIKEQQKSDKGFYCAICKASFQQATQERHESSILHIFNTKPRLPNIIYGISKQNKGYQILLNAGWDEQGGLGPSGKGIKYPVKTYLKTDRKGLGYPNQKEYGVAHFKAEDTVALTNLKMKNDQLTMLKHIQQVEEKAGEILRDQQEIIALDHRRNENRVGMRALQKQKQKKAWITIGPLLLKMSSNTAEELLVTDQQECDIEINKLRSNLKIKVNELRDLELNPPVPGLMLKPMSHNEMSAMKHVLG